MKITKIELRFHLEDLREFKAHNEELFEVAMTDKETATIDRTIELLENLVKGELVIE